MHYIVKLWPVAEQTFIIYVFLIVALRVIGRGRLGQLTVIDLVSVLLIGTCVETSMVAFNNHLDAGLVSAATLLIGNKLFTLLVARSKPLKALINADPVLLVTDGVIVREHVRQSGLTDAQVLQAVRGREHADLSTVKYAILETDGEINVVPKDVVILKSRIPSRRTKPSPPANLSQASDGK
jgi:uncharacterized membrane protein YcaP (DUF421 family)